MEPQCFRVFNSFWGLIVFHHGRRCGSAKRIHLMYGEFCFLRYGNGILAGWFGKSKLIRTYLQPVAQLREYTFRSRKQSASGKLYHPHRRVEYAWKFHFCKLASLRGHPECLVITHQFYFENSCRRLQTAHVHHNKNHFTA